MMDIELWLTFWIFTTSSAKATSLKFLKFTINSTQYANCNITFENLDNGNVLVNASIEFFQDVLKELHSVSVKAQKNDMDFNYDLPLVKTRVDSCRVGQGVMNSIFMKVFLEHFGNSSNYDFKCPFKAGISKMIDMPITKNFLPPFPHGIFPSGRMSFHIKDDLFGKIAKQKKMVRLYSWELFGKLFEDA